MPTQSVRPFLGFVLAAMLALVAGTSPTVAQTKPKILPTGIEAPASAIFIGNSFFYYNNSLHGLSALLLRSAEPNANCRAPRRPSAARASTGTMSTPISGRTPSAPTRSTPTTSRVQQARPAVRPRHHDGLQPVPDPSAAEDRVRRVRQEAQRHRAQARRGTGLLHVVGLRRQAGDDGAARRGLHAGRQRERRIRHSRGLAFAKSIARRPTRLYAADKRHPSLAGTYLAASTLYAALFKGSPVGLKYGAGLDEATAIHLQTVAWDTVQDYFGTAVSSK